MRMKKLYEAMQYASPIQQERLWDVIDEIFAEIKRKFPPYYEKYENKIYGILESSQGQSFRHHLDDDDYGSPRHHKGALGYINNTSYDIRERELRNDGYNRYR